MMTHQPVHYETATVFPAETHILRFSPTTISRFGVLIRHNKDGTDVFMIIRGAFETQTIKLDTDRSYSTEILIAQ